MKPLLLIAFAAALGAQQSSQTPPPAQKKGGGNQIPASAGDDVRGYNDTPQIPGQKWKVHDMTRPRPVKITPAPYVKEGPPSDAIVLFDGKDLSKWEQQAGRGGPIQEPKWKVQDDYFEIVPRTGRIRTKEKFGDVQLHVEWLIPKEAVGE
jgi:hypothetical protein